MGNMAPRRHAIAARAGSGGLHARARGWAYRVGPVRCRDVSGWSSWGGRRSGLPLCAKRRGRPVTHSPRVRGRYGTRPDGTSRRRYPNFLNVRTYPPTIPPRTPVTRLKPLNLDAVHDTSRAMACVTHCPKLFGFLRGPYEFIRLGAWLGHAVRGFLCWARDPAMYLSTRECAASGLDVGLRLRLRSIRRGYRRHDSDSSRRHAVPRR